MGEMMRILLDTNIILDVLMAREPHYQNSAKVWATVETGQAEGYLAAHTFTTLHYLYARATDKPNANNKIARLMQIFAVASVNQEVIQRALALNWPDFEDAVQMAAAEHIKADGLLTRDPKDFKGGNVRIWQPGEFLAILNAP